MRQLQDSIIGSGPWRWREMALGLAVTTAFCMVVPSAMAAPALNVSPTAVSFIVVEGGSNPPMQSISILASGPETVSWFATSSAPWVQVVPIIGTTPTSAVVMANVAGMTAGTYSGTILFASGQAGSSQVVVVFLTVTPQTPQSQ